MAVRIDGSLEGIDWAQAKADLQADDFDNGRNADALRRSFEQSQHVAFARDGERFVGMAPDHRRQRLHHVLVDFWPMSSYRRQGVASAMMRALIAHVPGHHIGLQTDDAQALYESLGFEQQPEFWSLVVGTWLDNDANR